MKRILFALLLIPSFGFAGELEKKIAGMENSIAELLEIVRTQQAELARLRESSTAIEKMFGGHGSKWIIEPQTGIPVRYKARYLQRMTPGGALIMELIEDERGPHPVGSIVHRGDMPASQTHRSSGSQPIYDAIRRGAESRLEQ